ncbi:DUF1631 family protein [Luteimonas sp. MC1572]|uniref:DUF1631 family protein n=1 Tax=Luteimonas sp. MC1572 TaxID=2799325 RepID=UPI0018F07B66|nr:DUF1631 family protein [Luteimonas sp. MC1572]MBJ6981250.1 DUF1631 family protein [Luteimonas sp. MC1572]QQO02574.1 DUF1631 family protein [Luteimonas sp. MC1572]
MREPARVFEAIKREAVTTLGGVLSGFWGTIEEQVRLEALAGHDYSGAQDDRMAVMALGHRALELATRYRDSLEREFDAWRKPPVERSGDKSLSLMSEGELEIHLAGQHTTELLDHQFLHPLELMEERLQALATALGVEGKRANPVRPDATVAAFVNLFGAEDLTRGLRPLVFNQFDKRLPEVLGELYEKLNSMLEAAGFGYSLASDAPVRGRQPDTMHSAGTASAAPAARGADGGGQWVPDGGMVEHMGGAQSPGGTAAGMAQGYRGNTGGMAGGGHATGGYAGGGIGAAIAGGGMHAALAEGRAPRYRDVVRDQLRHWRAAGNDSDAYGHDDSGLTESAAAIAAGVQVLRTEDLLSVAQILQGDDASLYTQALGASDSRELSRVIREAILGGVRQLGFDPDATHFSVDEEDAIDLVGMLFSSLSDSTDLAQRARDFYGRLVVPYLKVALTDDSMFNRRSHPARRLLDVLTEACDGNAGETPQDRETLDRAERAVDRVVEEYDDDQAIFELAASELRDQLEQQRRRTDLAEKRAGEAIHGRERLQQARAHAADMVASRLAGRSLTTPVAHFLDRHWRHHLTQAWLREGHGTDRHHQAIAVGDAMVQVDADAAQARGRVVAEQLLALQVPLGECYASCGMDATAARDAMARIIAALGLPDSPRKVHHPEQAADDVDGAEDASPLSGLHLAGGTDTLAFDPNIAARMRRLRVGQGLRLIDEDGHETAARIAWISPLTGRFLVVNRRGVRKMVVSPEELTVLVARGRAVIRSVDAPFDEAMKQVWQHLNPRQAAEGGG